MCFSEAFRRHLNLRIDVLNSLDKNELHETFPAFLISFFFSSTLNKTFVADYVPIVAKNTTLFIPLKSFFPCMDVI